MHLLIPSYPDPRDGEPIPSAAATVGILHHATIDDSGHISICIYRSAAKAEASPPGIPLERFDVNFGQVLTWQPAPGQLPPPAPQQPPVPKDVFPTFGAISTAAHALQAADPTLKPCAALRRAMLTALQVHPRFAGATLVP